MTWTFEIGYGTTRGYVMPMSGRGAPYRLTVTRGDGSQSLFVGLQSAASAVESFCTAIAARGEQVPMQARLAWEMKAALLDEERAEAVH